MKSNPLELRLKKQFAKAVTEFGLIADGDHMLIALSGGKDSLLLTELLGRRSLIHRPRFKVSAVHVRMENIPYETDTAYLSDFCAANHVQLHVVTTHFDAEPSTAGQRHKPECFLCAWQRRKKIFDLAQTLGCQKIAIGHHMDDILHTALMNELFEGRFASMPVKLKMQKMPLTIIRPLALCCESDILLYSRQQGYRQQKKSCPFERKTHRAQVADLFRQMEELNPEARYSLWHALETAGKLVEE